MIYSIWVSLIACIHHVGLASIPNTVLSHDRKSQIWLQVANLQPASESVFALGRGWGGVPIMGTASDFFAVRNSLPSPLPLVLHALKTDEIVLQNTVVKCVSGWRAAHPFFSALITFNNL